VKTQGKQAVWASRVLNFIGEWPAFLAVLLMGALSVAGITCRYLFRYPLHFVDEYNGYLMAVLVFLPLAWVVRGAGHIRLDVVIKAFSRRIAKRIEIATLLFSLATVIWMTVSVIQLAMRSFAINERSWTMMATPLGPVQLILVILLVIQIIVEIARGIGKRDARNEK